LLDRDCKAHELDNLSVADTSFFSSIGAVNPALTAIANAIRVGDHIAAASPRRGPVAAGAFSIETRGESQLRLGNDEGAHRGSGAPPRDDR
jgi:choline dehydrogenase-like flavoprotein